jgi:hypothetical protein
MLIMAIIFAIERGSFEKDVNLSSAVPSIRTFT